MGGIGDYKLATLCRGYWKAKLRTTIHLFFEPDTHFLASSRFSGRCPSPLRSFLFDTDDRLTTWITLPGNRQMMISHRIRMKNMRKNTFVCLSYYYL